MKYFVEGSDLTSVANAIRTKGGTNASLAFPSGFVSAINDIGGGGMVDADRKIIEKTISGTYTNTTCSYIKSFTFEQCNSLNGVEFTSVSYIAEFAFRSCATLCTANFPNLTSVYEGVFDFCS